MFTSDENFAVSSQKPKLDLFIANYPLRYVKLIYCFGYGEPNLLTQRIYNNPGTIQYWKIFTSCLAKNEDNLGFDRVLKRSTTDFFQRMKNKVSILQELKRRGIWLIDASLVGIYRGEIEDKDIKEKVIRASWDNFVNNIVADAHPKHIVVIGKGVADSLGWRLSSICSSINATYAVLPQPQGVRGDHEEQLEYHRQFQRICSKYAPIV